MENKDKFYIASLLAKVLTEDATAEEVAAIDEWRNASESNAALYDKMTRSYVSAELERIGAVDSARPMADMKARIARQRRKQRAKWLPAVTSIAAIICIIVGGNYLLSHKELPAEPTTDEVIRHGEVKATLTLGTGQKVLLDSQDRTIRNDEAVIQQSKNGELRYSVADDKSKTPEFNDLIIPRGGEFNIVLSDGTFVWLNSESKLHYPVSFGKERIVWLEGEAYFKVSKDENRPFKVITQGQTVTVTGTEFNISAYPIDGTVYTTLLSGEVAVAADGSDEVVNLIPNMQTVLDLASEEMTVKMVDVKEVASWRTGMFVFEGQTLDQIMRKLARWYNFEFTYADGFDLHDVVFKGKVPRYGDFNYVLSILEKSGGISFDVENKNVTISAIEYK